MTNAATTRRCRLRNVTRGPFCSALLTRPLFSRGSHEKKKKKNATNTQHGSAAPSTLRISCSCFLPFSPDSPLQFVSYSPTFIIPPFLSRTEIAFCLAFASASALSSQCARHQLDAASGYVSHRECRQENKKPCHNKFRSNYSPRRSIPQQLFLHFSRRFPFWRCIFRSFPLLPRHSGRHTALRRCYWTIRTLAAR